MSKHPQNGPTFSKAPPKKWRPLSDDEIAAKQAREEAELEEIKRVAARSRKLHQLLHKDAPAFLREIGFPKLKKD
jgi:hypothetical protein